MFAREKIRLRTGIFIVSMRLSVKSSFSISSRPSRELRPNLTSFTVKFGHTFATFLGPASLGRFSSRIAGRKKRIRNARNRSGGSISIKEVGIGIKFYSKILSR
jgi:hypothetical protein